MQNFVIDRNIRFLRRFLRNEITLLAHRFNILSSRLYGTPRAISGHFGEKTRFRQFFSEISKKIPVLPTGPQNLIFKYFEDQTMAKLSLRAIFTICILIFRKKIMFQRCKSKFKINLLRPFKTISFKIHDFHVF